jgi:hypothetical protein
MSVNGVILWATPEELDWLRSSSQEEIEPRMDEWLEEERALHLEKRYAAVHFLLTGTDHGGTGPQAFIASDGAGEPCVYEFAYGPARIFTPEATRSIGLAVNDLSTATIETRLRGEALREVYPFSLRALSDEDRTELVETLELVRRHVTLAVERGLGLVVGTY